MSMKPKNVKLRLIRLYWSVCHAKQNSSDIHKQKLHAKWGEQLERSERKAWRTHNMHAAPNQNWFVASHFVRNNAAKHGKSGICPRVRRIQSFSSDKNGKILPREKVNLNGKITYELYSSYVALKQFEVKTDDDVPFLPVHASEVPVKRACNGLHANKNVQR